MRRLGTKVGGKRGGRAMQKIFGKPKAAKSIGRIAAKGAGKGFLKGAGRALRKSSSAVSIGYDGNGCL